MPVIIIIIIIIIIINYWSFFKYFAENASVVDKNSFCSFLFPIVQQEQVNTS